MASLVSFSPFVNIGFPAEKVVTGKCRMCTINSETGGGEG